MLQIQGSTWYKTLSWADFTGKWFAVFNTGLATLRARIPSLLGHLLGEEGRRELAFSEPLCCDNYVLTCFACTVLLNANSIPIGGSYPHDFTDEERESQRS